MRGQDLLQKTSRAMSSKFDIRLIASGSQAMTDGRVIQVPSLPETMTQTEWEVLCGYSEHEVAHVRFSNFECIGKETDPMVRNLANLLEDIRIEKLHGDEFAGVRALLEKTLFHIWNKYYVSDKKEINIGAMLLFEGRKQCANLKLSSIPSYLNECKNAFGDDVFDRISALKSSPEAIALAKELLKSLEEPPAPPTPPPSEPGEGEGDGEGEGTKSEDAENDDDCKGKKDKSEKEEEEDGEGDGDGEKPKDKEEKDGDSNSEDGESGEDEKPEEGEKSGEDEGEDDGSGEDDDSGSGEGGENDTERDERGESGEDGDPEDTEGEDSGDGGDEEGEGDDGDGEGDDSGEGGGGDEASGDGSGSGDGDEDDLAEEEGLIEVETGTPSGEAIVDDRDGGIARPVKEILEAIKDGDMDVAEMLRDDLLEIHKAAVASKDYLVLSREFDVIKTIDDGRTEIKKTEYMDSFNKLKSSIEGFGPARSKLTGMFLARILNRWIGDRDAGRINPRALSKLRCGYKSVFREKTVNDDLNTAITFLVDYSGSMASRGIDAAMKTVILFLETLTQSKIKCEVLGYTTGQWPSKLNSLYRDECHAGRGRDYGRVDPLLTYIIKSFDEIYDNKVKRRIGAFESQRLSENCDGDSIMVAHHRISLRKEKRKILFVLSDGCVSNNGSSSLGKSYLKKVCETIEKEGQVELIGVGFNCDEVKRFFKNSILVNSWSGKSESLADTMHRELKKIFKV